MHKLGIDASRPPAASRLIATVKESSENGNNTHRHESTLEHSGAPASKRQKYCSKLPTCVVLDIEGTVAPISFVTDVMFPYAKEHVRQHLELAYGTAEGAEDIHLIRQQVRSCVAPSMFPHCLHCG
jgi:methylthioribulose 1-phosphate dehydratase/enolase-phosphatase E1